MSDSKPELNWSEVAIAMDRGLRLFADFSKPILNTHSASGMSITNLLFLLSIGENEARVNNLVKNGKYVGSNASYSLKFLEENDFIIRKQDSSDKRNAIVVCTEKGLALVLAIKLACSAKKGASKDVIKILQSFEDHCSKIPVR